MFLKFTSKWGNWISFLFCIYFSYNWPAQNDGVNYGDADEVRNFVKNAALTFSLWTKELLREAFYCLILLLNSLYRVIFATSLRSSFDSLFEQGQSGDRQRTSNNYAQDGKVWGVTKAHYSLMHIEIKSTNLPKYFEYQFVALFHVFIM